MREQGLEPNPQAEVIEIDSLNKYYGDFQALHNISLTVRDGQKLVICGASGSGKSTLIRCINALEPYQSGSIRVHGQEVNHDGATVENIRTRVGMVFQQFNLFPHLSILENCTLAPRKVRGIGKQEAVDRAMHYLHKVRIPDQAGKYPDQLSGGQQQRVAIARALCMQPDVMLFDEPTSALDPEMVQEVLDTLTTLAEDGMTMLLVTHEMGFARQIGDDLVFLDGGRILEHTEPRLFFTRPQHERAQVFLRGLVR